MRGSDLEEILSIEKISFTSPWSRCAFENEMRATYAYPLVMTESQSPSIIGYLCFWLVRDECQILNLAIHPSYRRRGIASQLIHHLLKFCEHKKITHCYLEVRASNQLAISLYHKCGFKNFGIRKNYYPDTGEDALIMKRRTFCP